MARNFKMKLQQLQFDVEVLGSMKCACLTRYRNTLDYASTFSYSSLSIKRHFQLKFYLRRHYLFLCFNESHSLLIFKLVLVSCSIILFKRTVFQKTSRFHMRNFYVRKCQFCVFLTAATDFIYKPGNSRGSGRPFIP